MRLLCGFCRLRRLPISDHPIRIAISILACLMLYYAGTIIFTCGPAPRTLARNPFLKILAVSIVNMPFIDAPADFPEPAAACIRVLRVSKGCMTAKEVARATAPAPKLFRIRWYSVRCEVVATDSDCCCCMIIEGDIV